MRKEPFGCKLEILFSFFWSIIIWNKNWDGAHDFMKLLLYFWITAYPRRNSETSRPQQSYCVLWEFSGTLYEAINYISRRWLNNTRISLQAGRTFSYTRDSDKIEDADRSKLRVSEPKKIGDAIRFKKSSPEYWTRMKITERGRAYERNPLSRLPFFLFLKRETQNSTLLFFLSVNYRN